MGWLWHQPLIRFMAILTGGNNLVSSGYALIIIVLAQNMHASSFIIGVVQTILIGTVVMVLLALSATINKHVRHAQPLA